MNVVATSAVTLKPPHGNFKMIFAPISIHLPHIVHTISTHLPHIVRTISTHFILIEHTISTHFIHIEHTIFTYSSLIMLLFEGGGSEVNRSISEDGTQRSVTRSRRQG